MKWRYFAQREFPRVVRELGIPCAEPVRVTGMARCPRHQEPLGRVARMCNACHKEAWDEVGRRSADAEQGRTGTSSGRKPSEADGPPLQTFPGPKRKPIPGQLSLLDENINREENIVEAQPTGTREDLDVVEGELVPAVIERPDTPGLFGTDDPALVIVKAVDVSNALACVVRDRKLYARISGKEHVLVGGWTLLGSMLGVYPVTVWSRQLEDGWEARVEARTRDGAVVGAAESECLRSERRWAKADDYAVRSMAQTRATSKALRLTLGFVMELAGFDATPADEMPVDGTAARGEPEPPRRTSPADPVAATSTQVQQIAALLRSLQQCERDVDWKAEAQVIAGVPARMLTRTGGDVLIRQLEERLAALAAETA